MFLQEKNLIHQKQDEDLFNLDLKKLEEYVRLLDQGGFESKRPKCVLSKKLFELLSAEKIKENPDVSRIKKILIAAYFENSRLEKKLDQKGVMYRYAVMQGSMNKNYQFDFEAAVKQTNDNVNIPKKIDRGLLGFAKFQTLHKLIYNLFEQICTQEKNF